MKRAFVVFLLLQAVYAGRNISIVIDGPRQSPAGVTYVEGNAPEELKAGPVKNSTESKERITHAAFIHSSSRAIPKDHEIENEEFERFIKKHHNRPTIETVYVSSSPSPLSDQESDEYNEESPSLKSEAELFKRPEQSETFQRHVALPSVPPSIYPPSDHGHTYTIVNQPPQEVAVHHGGGGLSYGGGGVSYGGNEGIIFQTDGGQYSTIFNGHFLPGNNGQYGGGEQYFYHVAQPGQTTVPGTVNIPQYAVKTKTYQIRRPAIQKHYYDIEERVIIRPAGSVVVELDRPVAKIPTGETIVGLQGSQGGFGGVGIQESQGGFGISQGGLAGVGIQQQQGVFGVSQGGLAGGGIQQQQGPIGVSQGGLVGGGIQQQQGAIGVSQGGLAGGGIQQQQGAIGVTQGGLAGGGIQQQQGTIGVSQGGLAGGGIQQQQGAIGASQGRQAGGGIQQQGAIGVSQGGLAGGGIQQQQGAIGVSQGGLAGGGIQQQQGAFGVSQGGLAGGGIQQQPGAIGVSQGGLAGVGIQQQQGAVGASQNGFGGIGIKQQQGGGIQQSQRGISFSTTPTPSVRVGVSQGGLDVAGNIGSSQGGFGVLQGGSQGGLSYSTTFAPSISTVGFQQSQGGLGVLQGGGPQGGLSYSTTFAPSSSSVGFQQSQGGIGVLQGGGPQGGLSYSTTFAPSSSSVGFQQSQGGIGVLQGGGPQGGLSYSTTFAPSSSSVGFQQFGGSGIQQSLGGVRYSTTFAPSSSSVSIGGQQGAFSGGFGTAGFQQSQGGAVYSTTAAPFFTPSSPAPTISIGGSYGTAGFQQSQGAVGVSQGGQVGAGFQQSQGGVFSSTTPGPFVSQQPGYSSTSSIGLGSQTSNGGSVVVESKSNVQNKGTFSSSSTTERSFTTSVSQDASAYAKAGSVQAVSKNITPYMIAVGEPDFHYPPYVQITSNGSPLGHYQQQPNAQIQAPSQPYPRMRYQGQLLTGEVREADDGAAGYGALSQNVAQQKSYESPAYVAEIPQNTPYEQQEGELQENTQYQQHQLVGSSQQPHQTAQVSSGAHQQPAQVHQHHFVTATSQPVRLAHQQQYESAEDAQQPIGEYQQPAQVYQVSQQQVHSHKPNLVAQIRHQHDAQAEKQTAQVQAPVYQQHPAQYQKQYVAGNLPQHAAEVTEQSVEIPEVRSSTHRQFSQQQNHPNFHYEQQVLSTTHQPEPYNSGQRLYKQRVLPSKYTQHHTINVAPAQHNIFFNNQPHQAEGSARSQNLETSPELESNVEDDSVRTATAESTTKSAPLISSTTPIPCQSDNAHQSQRQTYASVLASGKPDILYATSPVPRQRPNHTPFLRFTSQGSSLFTPNGRQVHLLYSQPPRASHSPQIAPTGAAAESSGHHITLERLQAQAPTSHQKQIELTATAPASEPEQPRSEYQQNAPISSTTPATSVNTNDHYEARGHQKYRNEQTHGAITLRSGRTYGNHRVIASTPAPSDGGAASESVQTRRIVVNHPFQTVQEVVEQEPISSIRQVTVNGSAQVNQHDALQAAAVQPSKEIANQEAISNVRQVAVNEQAQAYRDGPQQDQQKAAYRHPTAAYKVAATFNHPAASLNFHNGGSH